MKNAMAKVVLGMSMLAVVWALGAGCGKPYTTSPTAAKTTATFTPTWTPSRTGTPVIFATNTFTETSTKSDTPTPTPTLTLPAVMATSTPTGCGKICAYLDPVAPNPAPAGGLVTGYAFTWGDTFGGSPCPVKIATSFTFDVVTTGNLSTEIQAVEFWSGGSLTVSVPWTGSPLVVSHASGLPISGEVRYQLSSQAAGTLQTTLSSVSGYYSGYPGDPQVFYVTGVCGQIGTPPSFTLTVLPPTPTATATCTYTLTQGTPIFTPTPTNTGCAKFCVQLTPLIDDTVPAGYLATGYAFNLNDAIGGGTCPSKVLSYFSFAVTTAGNLSTEILGIEFWRNGAKVADVPWTGSAFTVIVAPAMTYYGEVRYVLSANAAGAVTTTITGAGGYYNGYPGDPQAFWISGNCGTYTTPSQGLWVLPPPPTATATVHVPGSCPASITCGTNGSGLVEAVGYGAGTAGSESVTCTSMNGSTGAIYTETVDAASDSSDIYTVFLPYMGNPVCVILDSFDNGSGANQFTLSAYHCLGVGRTGTVNTLCGGGVVMMQTTAQAYDTNVTIEVTATQGSGPYRLIVLNQ